MLSGRQFALAAFVSIPCLLPDHVSAATSTLSELVVTSTALNEEQPTGTYGQPEWTNHRRFGTTRVYIQKDPWEVGVAEWYRLRTYDDGRVTQRLTQEIEIGLPYRMQLDFYEKVLHDNSDGDHWRQDEFAVELRYAFADWGKIFGNPTLYEEYAFTDGGPDVLESKILFGDDYKGWHWGVNGIWEQKLWGEKSTEWGVAFGLSRVILDSKLSIGVEGKWAHPEGGDDEYLLGPSIQWLPTDNTHLDLIFMGGLNDAAPETECYLIFGFDFGASEKSKGYKPTTIGGGL